MYKQFSLLLLLLLPFTVSISGQQVALKTNVLFLATASPNAGVEIGIGKKFSVDIWGAYNPWKFNNKMHLNFYLAQPEVPLLVLSQIRRTLYWPARSLRSFQYRTNPFYSQPGATRTTRHPLRRRTILWLSLGYRTSLGIGGYHRSRLCPDGIYPLQMR